MHLLHDQRVFFSGLQVVSLVTVALRIKVCPTQLTNDVGCCQSPVSITQCNQTWSVVRDQRQISVYHGFVQDCNNSSWTYCSLAISHWYVPYRNIQEFLSCRNSYHTDKRAPQSHLYNQNSNISKMASVFEIVLCYLDMKSWWDTSKMINNILYGPAIRIKLISTVTF